MEVPISVLPGDIAFYGSANMPEQDALTIGGAIDFTRRIDLSDISPTGTLDVVSSNAADTATQFKYGVRDASGAEQTVTGTVAGTTPVVGAQAAERLLYGMLSGATANGPSTPPAGTAPTGDVAIFAHTRFISTHTAQSAQNSTLSTPALIRLQSGDVLTGGPASAPIQAGMIVRILNNTPVGVNFQLRRIIATAGYSIAGNSADVVAVNADWATIPTSATTYEVLQGMLFESTPNRVSTVLRLFERVAADVPTGGQRTYYEKVFAVNNNLTISLTQAQIQVASENPTLPIGVLLDMGLTTALNDTATAANRQTAPAAITFITQPAFINVPAPGNLPAGSIPNAAGAQGVWLRYTLPAGAAAYKGAIDIRTQGVTT